MLTVFLALALSAPSDPPRPKPHDPQIWVQVFKGETAPQLGPEVVHGVATPTLDFTGGPERPWIAVEVPAAVGNGAGEGSAEAVVLTVKQKGRTRSFTAMQSDEGDAVTVPFFVPLERCGDLELSAKVGRKRSPVVKIKVKC